MKLARSVIILCAGLGICLSGCAPQQDSLPVYSFDAVESSQAPQPESQPESESASESTSEQAVPLTGRAAWAGDEYVITEGAVLHFPTQEREQTVHPGDQLGDLVVRDAYTVCEAGAEDGEPVYVGVCFDGTITLTGSVVYKTLVDIGGTTVQGLRFCPDMLSLRTLPRTNKDYATTILALLDPVMPEIDPAALKGSPASQYTRFRIVLTDLDSEAVKDHDDSFYTGKLVSMEEDPVTGVPLRYLDEPLANKLTALAEAFCRAFPLPEFTSVDELNYDSPMISTRLFHLALSHNDELMAHGGGLAEYEREGMNVRGDPFLVRYRDMDAIGKYFFGGDFLLPEGEEFWEIEPSPGFPEFYQVKFGSDVYFRYNFAPVQITRNGADITLRLISCDKNYHSETQRVTKFVSGWDGLGPWEMSQEIGYFDLPADQRTALDERGESLLPYLRLTVPQEELLWYDVTFREENGRYVFASCQSRKSAYYLP